MEPFKLFFVYILYLSILGTEIDWHVKLFITGACDNIMKASPGLRDLLNYTHCVKGVKPFIINIRIHLVDSIPKGFSESIMSIDKCGGLHKIIYPKVCGDFFDRFNRI